MRVSLESQSFNSSVASSLYDGNEDINNLKIKNYYKEMLKSRIFLGRYIERRLIDQIIGYRDVILVSAAEGELKRDLLEAQQKLQIVCPNVHWIGITDRDIFGGHPAGVYIWTEIENQPFGPFWFQIKSLKYRENEIIVSLKCLRHITDTFLELEPILTGKLKNNKENTDNKPIINDVSLNETYNDIVVNLKSALSITNVKDFCTFLCALVIAVFTGSTTFVSFLGNFVLALIREMSIFMKNSTPMLLGILDFFSKIVGGFYILLAMFFKPNNPVPFNKRAINSYPTDRSNRQNMYYDDKEFD